MLRFHPFIVKGFVESAEPIFVAEFQLKWKNVAFKSDLNFLLNLQI